MGLHLLAIAAALLVAAVRAGSVQDDPGYQYPSPSKKVQRQDPDWGRRYGVSEPIQQPPVRLEDLYLDKYLQTQDPKYFEAGRYPAPPQPDLGPTRDRDGSPDLVRTDYIPNGKIIFLLEQADRELSQICTEDVHAHWAFETDISEETQLRAVKATYTLFAHALE